MATSSVSFSNTPQAGDDLYLSGGSTGTGLTEDTLSKLVTLNVMANDLGGNAKKLYSLDNGVEDDAIAGADLLIKDPAGTLCQSLGGATIKITEDGKVSYDTSGWSADFKLKLSQLAAGESTFDSFTYAIQLGNGTLSWATVRLEIAGSNDDPTVSVADLSGAVTQGDSDPTLTDSGKITFDDLDLNDTHSVTVKNGAGNTLGGSLSAIVTDPATGAGPGEVTWTYSIANSLTAHLGQNQSATETFTIRISDNHGGFIDQVVTITVTGTNDGPIAVADMAQGGENEILIVNVLANDTDLDDGHVFTLTSVSVDPGQGSVSIVGNQLRFDPGTDFDHLASGTSTKVTVSYTMQDEWGAQSSSTVTITVTGTNDAPLITSGASGSIDENADTSTVAYQAAGYDKDDDDSIDWSLGGTDAALFDIDADGRVTLKDPANYEAKSSYSIEVIATDAGGLSDSQAVTINVNDVNEAPTVTSGASADVDENADIATVIYTATANDPDAGDSIDWSLGGTDAALFNIDADGHVTLNNPANYEAKSSYSIEIIATDAGGLSDSQAVTINVNDVNEAPTVTSGASADVDENADIATVIYTATANDPDAGDSIDWSLGGDDAALFSIDADGHVTLNNPANFEAKSSYSIEIIATDAGGLSDSQAITINVNDVNEAPTAVSLVNTTTAIDENVVVGAEIKVADISITDDALGANALSLSGTDAASFSIIGTALYYTGASPNFEGNNAYSVTVNVNDAAVGGTPDASQNFTLSINNVNEAPTAVSLVNTTTAVDENVAVGAGIKVADITITDDALGTNALSLSGADAASFSIVGAALYYTGSSPDYETKNSYSVTVNVNDATVGGTPDASQNFTLNINNVNEAPASDPNDFDTTDNSGTAVIFGSTIVTTASGGSANERIVGTSDDNTIHGLAGNDAIFGGAGNDTIYGDDNNDALYGGSGNDTIYGGANSDTIYGGSGDDTVYGDENGDNIFGGSGNDILDGKAGNDTVVGGYGNDTITVSDGDDTLLYVSKLDGNDVVVGFDADSGGGQDSINLDALFDTYGTMSGVRSDHVSIIQSGSDTLVRIDTDNSTGTFEMTITLTGVTAANVTVGADILVGS